MPMIGALASCPRPTQVARCLSGQTGKAVVVEREAPLSALRRCQAAW